MTATSTNQTHHLTIDELDQKIVGLTAHINAATYELLVLVRQFDERTGRFRRIKRFVDLRDEKVDMIT